MPAKDYFHDAVVNSLEKDGWEITNEQFPVRVAERRLWIDIRAAKINAQTIILVEVKTFYAGQSMIEALANALGQYMLYLAAFKYLREDVNLILAIPVSAYDGIFSEPIGETVRTTYNIKLAVFDPETEEIVKWIT